MSGKKRLPDVKRLDTYCCAIPEYYRVVIVSAGVLKLIRQSFQNVSIKPSLFQSFNSQEYQQLQQVKDGAYCLASPYSSMFHSLLIKND